MLSLVKYLSSHADYQALLTFLSPKTLQVVSTKDLLLFARRISAGSRQSPKDFDVLADTLLSLGPIQGHSLELRNKQSSKNNLPCPGELSLGLYFKQLFLRQTWCLDLSQESLNCDDQKILWTPKSLYWEVDPVFAQGIRDMYSGFYLEKPELFEHGLDSIHLLPVKDLFLDYFGNEDQTQVKFELKKFQRAFTRIFEGCIQSKIKLSPDFLALGVMLLTLYQNLESQGKTYNVREAFHQNMA